MTPISRYLETLDDLFFEEQQESLERTASARADESTQETEP